MASMTVDNLDGGLVRQLHINAKKNGRSLGEEVESILVQCVVYDADVKDSRSTEDVIRETREAMGGGIELDLPPSSFAIHTKMAHALRDMADEQGKSSSEMLGELLLQALDMSPEELVCPSIREAEAKQQTIEGAGL